MKKDTYIRIALFFFVALLFSGCLLVPVAQSVSEVGVTASDRSRLLNEQVKKFQDALYWGNMNAALSMVTPERKDEFQKEFRALKKGRKVVSSQVQFVDLTPDAYRATVSVGVKSYNPSTLIITEQEENQEWVFSISNGWKLTSREVLPSES
jgi:hypothetical protein